MTAPKFERHEGLRCATCGREIVDDAYERLPGGGVVHHFECMGGNPTEPEMTLEELAGWINANFGTVGIKSNLVARARLFATAAHAAVGQTRKYTGEPYINHCAAVAEIVESVPHTPAMIAAAWLHDTIEDTALTVDLLQEEFGAEVASLVGWLTDVSRPRDGNRAVRKAKDRAHIARAPAAAKTIKLADLIDNTKSIVERDPNFAKVYLIEKAALLEVLREGDAELWKKAAGIIG